MPLTRKEKSRLMKVAATYRKEGMTPRDALNKAYKVTRLDRKVNKK